MPNFFVDVRQDFVYASRCPSRSVRPILKIKRARSEHTPHFDDFRVLFWVIQTPTSTMPNFCVDIRQDHFYASSWPLRLVRPILKVKRAPKRAYPSFQRFSCAIANKFLGDSDYYVKKSKSFCRRPSRPCLCIRLSLTDRPTHFEGQTSPKASIPVISTIFVCYNKPFFG